MSGKSKGAYGTKLTLPMACPECDALKQAELVRNQPEPKARQSYECGSLVELFSDRVGSVTITGMCRLRKRVADLEERLEKTESLANATRDFGNCGR